MKPLIILIDDDHGPMDYFVKALELRGFEVKHLDSIDDASIWLESATNNPPAVVIVDMMMPPGKRFTLEETEDGLSTGVLMASEVRRMLPTTPLLVLTNCNDDAIVGKLPMGTEKLAKYEMSPFDFSDFVKHLLEHKQ